MKISNNLFNIDKQYNMEHAFFYYNLIYAY